MSDIFKKITLHHEPDIKQTARLLAERGWAEGNGGNFSIRLDRCIIKGERVQLPSSFPALAGQSLLVKSRGSRMRDVAIDPLSHVTLLSLSEKGESYIFESSAGFPTSELLSHLAVHELLSTARPNFKVLLHTHPTNLIALTHLLRDPKDILRLLPRMYPEAAVLLSGNLEMLPYLTPGSEDLGKLTAHAFKHANAVIWSLHGMIAAGEDIAGAFDLIEVTDKAAKIAILSGVRKRKTGIPDSDIEALARLRKLPSDSP
ncbi:rhamnulose-1-phosphate aldolase [bacterium]|nr:rhamnulose-1-phosphate aldolase [bacterium]